MIHVVRLITAALLGGACALAAAATNVGVTVDIHQPGVYGRISFGSPPPPPALVLAQPVLIAPPAVVYQRPIYLYVPPGHQKNWAKHCHAYNACAQPVYFVRETWVRDEYARRRPDDARYHDRGRGYKDDRKGKGKGHGRGRSHD